MMQVIIYKNDEGGVSVIYPIQEALDIYGIDAIAKKDVPSGKPYKIVDITDLPMGDTLNMHGIPNVDRTLREQWDIDDSELTDGVGAEYSTFDEVQNDN